MNDNSAHNIDQDQLLSFIDGSITPEQKRIIEQKIAEDPLLEASIEGLRKLGKVKAQHATLRVQQSITNWQKLKLHHNKSKRKVISVNHLFQSVIIILVMIIIAFAFFYFYRK